MRIKLLVLALAACVGCGTIPGTPTSFPAPDKPDGPKVAAVGQQVKFETEGTDPLDVHEYQWDFGDYESDWSKKNETIKHTYSATGTFDVKAKERCPLYLFVTDWSEPHKIMVTKPAAGRLARWWAALTNM